MIKTGSVEDKERFFMYGDQEKENAAGKNILLLAGTILAILIICGSCVLVYQAITNQEFHDVKLPWESSYRTYEITE